MKLTFFLDVLSLWCFYAMRSVERLEAEFGSRLEVTWKPAPIRGDRPLGYGSKENARFYARAEEITGERLDPTWLEGPLTGTREANLAALAAAHLGRTGLEVPAALMRAAMEQGRPVGRRQEAAIVAAQAAGLDPYELEGAMDDEAVIAAFHQGNAEMATFGVDQRPVLVFENVIPDRAILSGVWALEPMRAIVATMLRDEERFLAFNRDHPGP
jgi:predicted DsbA family dithiol-disulfide isomerase